MFGINLRRNPLRIGIEPNFFHDDPLETTLITATG